MVRGKVHLSDDRPRSLRCCRASERWILSGESGALVFLKQGGLMGNERSIDWQVHFLCFVCAMIASRLYSLESQTRGVKVC